MRSILVVEDEPLVRQLLEDVLFGSGLNVRTAESAEAAIAIIAETSWSLAAVMTDIRLGDRTSGWEVARYARSCNPDLQIIYMSANCGHEWPWEGVPNSLFLQKPFASSRVLRALASLLDQDGEDAA